MTFRGMANLLMIASVVAGCEGAVGPQGPQGPAGKTGLAGEQGADGLQGPQGPAGAEGLPGVSGYEVVLGDCTLLPDPPQHGFQRVLCPGGKVVIGGGVAVFTSADCTSPSGEADVTYSGLEPPATDRWVGDVLPRTTSDTYFQVQAICITAL